MSDLSIVDTDDLLEELLIRFDQALFAGRKFVSDAHDAAHIQFRGDPLACCGLTDWAKFNIMSAYEARGCPADDEGVEE